MKAEWKSYLEEDEVGRGFVCIQWGTAKRTRQVYAEFSPSEMEDDRAYVEAVLQEAHVVAHSRNSESNKKIPS
jgi:hypothetical protein